MVFAYFVVEIWRDMEGFESIGLRLMGLKYKTSVCILCRCNQIKLFLTIWLCNMHVALWFQILSKCHQNSSICTSLFNFPSYGRGGYTHPKPTPHSELRASLSTSCLKGVHPLSRIPAHAPVAAVRQDYSVQRSFEVFIIWREITPQMVIFWEDVPALNHKYGG